MSAAMVDNRLLVSEKSHFHTLLSRHIVVGPFAFNAEAGFIDKPATTLPYLGGVLTLSFRIDSVLGFNVIKDCMVAVCVAKRLCYILACKPGGVVS